MAIQTKDLKERINKLLDLESYNVFRMILVLDKASSEPGLIKTMNKKHWRTYKRKYLC